LISLLSSTSLCSAGIPVPVVPALSNVIEGISRRGYATLTRSVPALSVYNRREGALSKETLEVAVKGKKRRLKLPQVNINVDAVASQLEDGGFYYGITPKTLSKASTSSSGEKRRPRLSDSMQEALEELKVMRIEMETMRKEMQSLRRNMSPDGEYLEEESEEQKAELVRARRRRQRDSEKLATEIEQWTQQILNETEEDGWKEVACHKMMRNSVNPTGRTKTYLKV
jgi:hypothetical protein